MGCARVIHVVNDDVAVRSALERHLGDQGHCVRTFVSVATSCSVGTPDPDCLVVDARRDEPNGSEWQDRIARDGEAVPIIVIGEDGDVATAVMAMKAGAIDFLSKPVSGEALDAALEHAFARTDEWRSMRSQRAHVHALLARLTAREMQVYTCLRAGMRNKEIAAALDSREGTIKVHRSRLMRKLESRTLAELLNVGRRLGAPAMQNAAHAHSRIGAANDSSIDALPVRAPYHPRHQANGSPRLATDASANNPPG